MIPPHRRMVEDLAGRGVLSPDWRSAFAAVPRHLFLPDVIADADTGGRVDREVDERGWMEAAYADAAVVTQVDDGARHGPGEPTSSSPAPSAAAEAMRLLRAVPGMRVLEVGTGSGYGAALLSHLLGDDAVVSVEIDFELAERARIRLMSAGFTPLVVGGDGMQGWAGRAPYDRVVSAVAVRRVPYAWVAQSRPGGRILTPWGNAFHHGALADLVVGPRGTAQGRFVGHADCVWARADRAPRRLLETYVRAKPDHAATRIRLGPEDLLDDRDASFAVGLQMPGVYRRVRHTGEAGDPRVYLVDPATGSWASWHAAPRHGESGHEVRQHGPRSLFTELEAARLRWVEAGRPAYTRFGLTVSAEHQLVWLDDEDSVLASSG
ncbi:protein-L-isoaspartate(D-aspartate) O-methyltransferase [Nocardiopsis sp. TSRI0078]|uniref:protein-L-isoaspartate(D-aspartate) O-methyltransferase n=1 Tax=unclassified Nocardiopsis TaxID=2649073 RepID=UPI00093C29EC|nr:protein-L-isoaspartate(D-aspartate) O-methyltransferase [Nocardiopsis sp. TSRI0078]OKI13050.1 protein-L-isoaspartate(D-aspartate) O-methyltransferase [Nocardiopsis sp. TSRI0078]